MTRRDLHPSYPWPYVVDTRRTIDPDYEVTRAQKESQCRNYEKSYGSSVRNEPRLYKRSKSATSSVCLDREHHKHQHDPNSYAIIEMKRRHSTASSCDQIARNRRFSHSEHSIQNGKTMGFR